MTATAEAAGSSHSHVKDILRLAVPAMLALASQPLLSIGDTAMIGRLGVEPLAARAVGAAIIGGIYWIFAFLSFGTTTLVGYHHGAQDFRACGETYLHALFLALLGGVGVACAGLLFATAALQPNGRRIDCNQRGSPLLSHLYRQRSIYFYIFCVRGILPRHSKHKNADGHRLSSQRDSSIARLRAHLWQFWISPPRYQRGRGRGLGRATCWSSDLSGDFLLFSFDGGVQKLRSGACPLTRLRPLFRIGSDLAIRTGALRGSLVFATSCTARMGASVLSAHEIAFQLMLLCSDVIDGLAVAGQALVAKYLGSAQKETAIAMGKTLILCGAVAGLLFAILFLGAQEAIVSFFTNSTEVKLLLGAGVILLVALFQPLNGIVFVLDGLLIGARDTRFLMWAMLIGALGIFVPISWMSLHWGWGLTGIWAGVGALMSWRLATLLYRFFSRKWSWSLRD